MPRRAPPGALVAGWPKDLNNVPYVTGRTAFLTSETRQAFHRGYADQMRERLAAVIDATYSSDPAALRRLRDECGVDHFVVDREVYGPKAPPYFAPFDREISEAHERAADHYRTSGTRPAAWAAARRGILDDGDWTIVPLRAIP